MLFQFSLSSMKLYTKKFVMLVDILVLVSHQIVNIYIYISRKCPYFILLSSDCWWAWISASQPINAPINITQIITKSHVRLEVSHLHFKKKSKGDIRNQGKSCVGVNWQITGSSIKSTNSIPQNIWFTNFKIFNPPFSVPDQTHWWSELRVSIQQLSFQV